MHEGRRVTCLLWLLVNRHSVLASSASSRNGESERTFRLCLFQRSGLCLLALLESLVFLSATINDMVTDGRRNTSTGNVGERSQSSQIKASCLSQKRTSSSSFFSFFGAFRGFNLPPALPTSRRYHSNQPRFSQPSLRHPSSEIEEERTRHCMCVFGRSRKLT